MKFHRFLPALSLFALTACDDAEGGDAPDAAAPVALAEGLYRVEAHLRGPCGAPEPVGACEDCYLEDPFVQVEILELGADRGHQLSACQDEDDDRCTLLAILGAGVSLSGGFHQRMEPNGEGCRVTSTDLELRDDGGVIELVFRTLALDLAMPCDLESDGPRFMDGATCQSEEIARLAPL